MRRFELHRDHDVSGVSGVGIVADGIVFPDGIAVLHWRGEWPTSVVWYERGVEAVEHIHGHGGNTRLVWVDDEHERTVEIGGQVMTEAQYDAARYPLQQIILGHDPGMVLE